MFLHAGILSSEKNGEKQMEENNGIKIKANVIYSIVKLPALGMFVFFEVYGIKNLIAGIEIGKTLVVFFVIHLAYLYFAFDLINLGRKIELTKEGCMISFLWIKRRYSWEEYPVKKIERYSDQYNSWAPVTPYEEGAVFSKVPVKRSKKYRPAETRSYLTRYVFSTVWICFRNEECKKKWAYYTDLFEVDKEGFFQKMEEWGVELEMPE